MPSSDSDRNGEGRHFSESGDSSAIDALICLDGWIKDESNRPRWEGVPIEFRTNENS